MKKLISIIAALTMLFTFAAIPALADEVSIDFTAEENLAYGKKITHVAGYYYSASTPTATNQKATDGDITTFHSGYGKVNGATTGTVFYIDLEQEYELSEISLFISQGNRGFNVYSGTSVNADNLIMTVDNTNVVTTVNGTGSYVHSKNFPAGTKARFLTIERIYGDGFPYHEIYIKGVKQAAAFNPFAETIDFADASNIAYGKRYQSISAGNYWSSAAGIPNNGSNQVATDGNLTTLHSCDGGTGIPYACKGIKFYIDLGSVHTVKDVTLYGGANISAVKFYDGMLKVDNATRGDYKLLNQDGSVATPLSAPVATKTGMTVNGTTVDVANYDIEDVNTRYLTVEYDDEWSFVYNEIYVNGTPVALNLAEDNIAKNKPITLINYRWSPSFGLAFDGDITTSGAGQGNATPALGTKFRVDLGAYYKLDEIVIYRPSVDSAVKVITGNNTSEEILAKAIAPTGNLMNINGTVVEVLSHEFSGEVARYITIHVESQYVSTFNEIVVKGTPVTAITDAGKSYSFSGNNVTAELKLFNGSDAATVEGVIYFAAYGSDNSLVGFGKADLAALAVNTGATTTPVTFAVSEEPDYVKAFYWSAGSFVPVIAPIDIK